MKDMSRVQILIMIAIFIISIFLVFYGRATTGYVGLFLEIIGIIGLIIELYLYNQQYK